MYMWVIHIYMLACIIRRLCVYICWYVLYIYPHENAGDMHIITLACINIICYCNSIVTQIAKLGNRSSLV